jgi:hypothetical protein
LVAVGDQHPEAVAVGARQLGQHEAVKHIALAARHAGRPNATNATCNRTSREHNARIPGSS